MAYCSSGCMRQDQHRQLGEFLLQLLEGVDAVAVGHRDIEQEDVPLAVAGQLQRFDTVVGLAGDDQVIGLGKDLLAAPGARWRGRRR